MNPNTSVSLCQWQKKEKHRVTKEVSLSIIILSTKLIINSVYSNGDEKKTVELPNRKNKKNKKSKKKQPEAVKKAHAALQGSSFINHN